MLMSTGRDTSGQKRVFEQLVVWKRQAAFRAQPFTRWTWMGDGGQPAQGGDMKSVGKLSFVSVEDAGHLPAVGQPAVVAWVIRCWVAKRKDVMCPHFVE